MPFQPKRTARNTAPTTAHQALRDAEKELSAKRGVDGALLTAKEAEEAGAPEFAAEVFVHARDLQAS